MADPIKTAKKIFERFLSKADPVSMPGYDPDEKDPEAQRAGRKGGFKGGKARAATLSQAQRKMIARRAARTRWKT